ncbi:hypothetical protein V6Z11_A10G107300 [Gossypium hirsutum]
MAISKPLLVFFSLVFYNLSFSWAALDPTYQSLLQCLSEIIPSLNVSAVIVSNNNPSFASILESPIYNARFNRTATPKPAIIITPSDESHVSVALKIRSGGHDYEVLSYTSNKPFFLLNMYNHWDVSVDIQDYELYYYIWEKSNVHRFPAGVCPTVGVGGHISGAGYGTMIRKYGLSTDYVIDAKIVDAIRGAGGANFGVVTAYKIKLVKVPLKATVFKVERFLDDNGTEVAFKRQTVANNVKVTIMGLYLADINGLLTLLNKDFPELRLNKENCTEMTWIDSVLWWENFDLGTPPNVLLDRNNKGTKFVKRKSDYMVQNEKVGLTCNSYGGKMDEIDPKESAFPHRKGNFYKIKHSINWDDPNNEADIKYTTQAKAVDEFMTQFVSKNPMRAYLNYTDINIGSAKTWSYEEGKVYGESYFAENFDRMVDVKIVVDPNNFFRNEQSIPPRSTKTA